MLPPLGFDWRSSTHLLRFPDPPGFRSWSRIRAWMRSDRPRALARPASIPLPSLTRDPANHYRIFARGGMVRGVCSCFEKAGAHLADAGAKKRAMANVEAHDRAEVLYPRKQKVSIWIDLAQKRLEGCVGNPTPRLRNRRRSREALVHHSRRLTRKRLDQGARKSPSKDHGQQAERWGCMQGACT